MYAFQCDLFKDNSDFSLLKEEIHEVKKKGDNLRKGMFFRHHELEKTVFELKDEIEKLKQILLEVKKV